MKFLARIAAAVLVCLVVFGLFPLYAQAPAPTSESSFAPVQVASCDEAVRVQIDEEAAKLASFVDRHFQNEKEASLLLPAAIERFRIHTKTMYRFLDDSFPVASERAADAVSRRAACEKTVADALNIQKEILRAHVLQNAHAKQTTRLLDAMKETNAKLEKLHFDVAQMYGYMEVFSTKLPCYIKQCN